MSHPPLRPPGLSHLVVVGLLGSGCLQPTRAPTLDAEALGQAESAIWFSDSPGGTWIESLPIQELGQTRIQTLTDDVEPELWLYDCPVEEVLSPRRVLSSAPPEAVTCEAGGAPCPQRAFRLSRLEPSWVELPQPPAPRPWPIARPSPCAAANAPRTVALQSLDQQNGTVTFLTPIGEGRVLVGAFDYLNKVIRGRLWWWEVPEASDTSWQPELKDPVLTSSTVYLAGAPLSDGRVALWGDGGVTAIAELRGQELVVTPGPRYPIEAQRCPRSCLRNECDDRCEGNSEPDCVANCLADPRGCVEHSRMAQLSVAGPLERPTWWVATGCRNLLKGDGSGPFEIVRARDEQEVKSNLPFDVLAVGPDEAYAAGVLERGVLYVKDGRLEPQVTEEMLLPTTALMKLDQTFYTTVRVELAGAFLYRLEDRNWKRTLQLGTQEVVELQPISEGFLGLVEPPGHLVQGRLNGLCRGSDFIPGLSASYRAQAITEIRGHQLVLMELSQNSTELAKGLLAVFELTPAPRCTRLEAPPLTPVEAGP